MHRRGIAAYLAAYGLLGRGLPELGHPIRGPFPVRLEFETDRPTDDITCVLSDGSSLFVSAKRACGDDRHLGSTALQWADQATLVLGDTDLLVLAVAEPKGIVKHLGAALLRHHAGPPSGPAPQAEALMRIRELLSDKPTRVRDRVLGAARVLTVDAAEPGRHEFDLAAAMLEGTIVAYNNGAAAMQALSQSMHTQAGKAFASGIDDWIEALRAAGIEVFADARGPAGAMVRARQAAIEEHLARLQSRDGRIDLSLLADDLPPLKVKDLGDGLQAALDGGNDRHDQHPLLTLARRWPRMLLVGLPGSGKSTALSQLAANWAAYHRAPIPVLVSLSAISRRCTHPGELTLGLLCDAAATEAPLRQRADLAAALETLCLEGGAVLLLDGLDECANRRAVITDGLSALFSSLHPDTGVVLATRASGVLAAQRLSLPTAYLGPPENLDNVQHQLLQHVASVRVVEADRESWVRTRCLWLQATREKYRDLGSVPLLATLLTLVAADSSAESLPQDQASLLTTAVQNSVRRWESQRQEMPYGLAEKVTDAQLLDGYAALGHLLASGGEITMANAVTVVSQMLAEHWGLHPRPAEEAALQILWFWDEHVGVFVGTSTGTIAPRSRVFAEIASAMWVRNLPERHLTAWVSECSVDADRHHALLLAADMDPRIIAALLADEDGTAAALIAVKAVRRGIALDPDQLMLLASRLAAGASRDLCAPEEDVPIAGTEVAQSHPTDTASALMAAPLSGESDSRNGPGWQCACELAQLRLPSKLSDHRRRLMAPLALTKEQRIVAQALCALSDAAAAARELEAAELGVVLRALDLPLPEEEGLVQQTRRRFVVLPGASLIDGHAEVGLAAARQLFVLDRKIATRIHEIADMSSYLTYPLVTQALAARGYRFKEPGREKTMETIEAAAAAWRERPELSLLEAAAGLSGDDPQMSAAGRWRLPELGRLFAVLSASRAGFQELLTAATADSNEIRRGWMKAAVAIAGLDVKAVAAQARLAIHEQYRSGENDTRRILSLLFIRPPGHSPVNDPKRLGPDDHAALISCLGAHSSWIARTAYTMLLGVRSTRLQQEILTMLPSLPARRRYLAAQVACCAARSPVNAADELLRQTDPPTRAGSVRLLSLLTQPNEQALLLLAQASIAEDLTIRLATRQPHVDNPPATIWSCRECASGNKLAELDCQFCDYGTRPKE